MSLYILHSYLESANSLSKETNLDLTRYEVCDNIDLSTILMEYESYYYVKFNRYPKVTKKLTQSGKFCITNECCYKGHNIY